MTKTKTRTKKLKPLSQSDWYLKDQKDKAEWEAKNPGDKWYSSLFSTPGYEELLSTFEVEVLVNQSLGSYQGDYLVILRDKDHYGFLEFSYGSCSGCDSLAGCDTVEQAEEVRDGLWESVQWKTVEEMRDFIRTRKWEDHYYHSDSEFPKFLDAAKKAVGIDDAALTATLVKVRDEIQSLQKCCWTTKNGQPQVDPKDIVEVVHLSNNFPSHDDTAYGVLKLANGQFLAFEEYCDYTGHG